MKTNVVMTSKDRVLFDVQIRQETQTSFLNVSDLQAAYDNVRVQNGWSAKRIDTVTQTDIFKQKVCYLVNENTDLALFSSNKNKSDLLLKLKSQGITNVLKEYGVWKTTGARHTKTVWCNPYIWFLIAKGLFPLSVHEKIDLLFKKAGYEVFEVQYIRHEHQFSIDLELATKDIVLWERQYKVDNFRIDFYSKQYNLAVEYDEEHHKSHVEYDKKRQDYIESKIKGIIFIRIRKGFESEGFNQIIKHLLYAR